MKKQRLCSLVAVAALLMGLLAGCGEQAKEAAGEIITQTVTEKKAPPKGYVPQENGFRYAKSQLTTDQQYIYDQIVTGIQNQAERIEELYPDNDMIFAVTEAIHRDYPEFFWYNGGGKVETTYMGGVPISADYLPEYTMDSASRATYQEQIDRWTADCLGSIPVGSSDYDKVIGVYQYVISHTDYQKVDANSIVNIMVHGAGLCGCYAMTTQYLLNRVGVNCTYISGWARGEKHAWNLVWPDGNPCWLDTTWGDPVFEGGSPGDGPSYDYFCISTADLCRTHRIEDTVTVPDCVCESYNYYRHSGHYFDVYERDALAEPMEKAVLAGEKQVSFRFADGAYGVARESLFGGTDLSDLFRRVDKDLGTTFSQADRFTYTCNDTMGTMTLIFPS